MSAYSDWKCGALTDDEFKMEMRRECGDDYEDYLRDEAIYTDDADDPHWKCENCGHCKTFNARRPVIVFTSYTDEDGYVHNNPQKPHGPQNYYARWSFENDYLTGNICELTRNQVMDDDYCENFEEVE